MGLLNKMQKWQDEQLAKGEARVERLEARQREHSAKADEYMAQAREIRAKDQYNCTVGLLYLRTGMIGRAFTGQKYAASDCTVEFIRGDEGSRFSASRTMGGALLGGAGAVVGASARKATGTGWVVVTHPGGTFQERVNRKMFVDAARFEMNARLEAERQLAAH